MNWEERAQRLAGEVTHPASRWRPAVAATPRHVFTPHWWQRDDSGQWLRRSAADEPGRPYENRTLVTRAGGRHADHAAPGGRAGGPPTSSSTMPGLVITMLRHAMLGDGMDVLDVGTGSGYGAALLAARLGDEHVTSVDVDPYLVAAATGRLAEAGLHPRVAVADATAPLDGEHDRIVSMMSVAPVPASWLAALRPAGRLVTTIAGTCLIVTADKTPDGGAAGHVAADHAGFMQARSGPGYPAPLLEEHPGARDGDGDEARTGTYPVVNIREAWDLYSMLGVTLPGAECDYEERDGRRTAWLLHPDGSWARATSTGGGPASIRQAGPRRLWDHLDGIRDDWLRHGTVRAYGARVTITPDGGITFRRGRWTATIPAAPGGEGLRERVRRHGLRYGRRSSSRAARGGSPPAG